VSTALATAAGSDCIEKIGFAGKDRVAPTLVQIRIWIFTQKKAEHLIA
jgi:hypothetical protein